MVHCVYVVSVLLSLHCVFFANPKRNVNVRWGGYENETNHRCEYVKHKERWKRKNVI